MKKKKIKSKAVNNKIYPFNFNKQFLQILAIVFLFLTIPMTVFVSLQYRDLRSKAAQNQKIPPVTQEENFKILTLNFSPQKETLSLTENKQDNSLPRPIQHKKASKASSVATFKVVQTNQWGQPVYTLYPDVEIPVNTRGKPVGGNVNFAVQVIGQAGKATFYLYDKKLLEVVVQ